MIIQRVLIPTDLSENSNAALNTAKPFIEAFNCKIDFIHVIPLSRYLGDSFDRLGIPLSMEKDVFPKIIENKREELNNFANTYVTNAENRGEVFISIDRKPSESIRAQAKKGKYDLIMMSAKGGHESDFFHGSVTEKIIRHSQTPVLTLAKHMQAHPVKTITVPCDFSNNSLAAIPVAFDMAVKFNANIELLNIVELYGSDLHGIEPAVPPLDNETFYDGMLQRIKEFFSTYTGLEFSVLEKEEASSGTIIREHAGKKDHVDFKIVISKSVSAHHEIINYANEHSDLLVMSTHGRTGLSRMLLGSTAEQVVQHVDIPQITIKPKLPEKS